ncbi:MAG: hypothetical protein ACYC61_15340 [Isosphaeraceae bacterium]
MATATAGSGRRIPASPGIVIRGVSWGDYEAMLRIVGERPIRITYDRGDMEVFVPSFGHNSDAYLLGRMVEFLTEEIEVCIVGGDTTTLKRQDLWTGAPSPTNATGSATMPGACGASGGSSWNATRRRTWSSRST